MSLTLAETEADGNFILPYSETDCDRLRGFLASEEPRLAGEENRMGRAMARLLAHELCHLLLQTRKHGKNGIENKELDRIRSSYPAANLKIQASAPVATFLAHTEKR